MMGPEASRALLHSFADFIADNLKPIIEQDREEWEARQKRGGE